MNLRKRHPKCPYCDKSDSVINHGRRSDSIRYFCKKCSKTFTKNYTDTKFSPRNLFDQYLDGNPLRKIAYQYGISAMTVFRNYTQLVKKLPQNLSITRQFCSNKKFGGYLVFDGKYISIKGFDKKIPLLWGIDFQTHDIPHFILAASENYHACLSYFSSLRETGYDLKYLICDDTPAMKLAAQAVYPRVVVQTCLTHYKEALRRNLGVRVNDKYLPFYQEVARIFTNRLCHVEMVLALAQIYSKYVNDKRCVYWIEDMMRRQYELTNYHMFEHTPNTTNLIEGYNSHLEARLKSIKGFESYQHAKTWLNAYILRRRLTPFSDCSPSFKHLNGFASMEKTLKDGLMLPTLFG